MNQPEDIPPDKVQPLTIEQQVLNHLPDGVAVIDEDNQILWANPRFMELAHCDDVLHKEFFSVLTLVYFPCPQNYVPYRPGATGKS